MIIIIIIIIIITTTIIMIIIIISNSHSVSHMLLIPIETLRYECDCLRKARETYLIQKDKTIEPQGKNKRDEL